jgi:hypothetical protein
MNVFEYIYKEMEELINGIPEKETSEGLMLQAIPPIDPCLAAVHISTRLNCLVPGVLPAEWSPSECLLVWEIEHAKRMRS